MFIRKTLSALCLLVVSAVTAQTLPNIPGLTNFQKIKVSQESVFQGRVFFDQGLNLTGDANFQNTVTSLGDFTAARSIRFPGIQPVDYVGSLITGDPNGNITRVPVEVLARALSQAGLPALQDLTVVKVTRLNGDFILGEGLKIIGQAEFKNDVITLANFIAKGGVTMTGLQAVTAEAEFSILGITPQGTTVTIPLQEIGLGGKPELPCFPETRASWRFSPSKITTGPCSDTVKVGIGTGEPLHRLHVFGDQLINGNGGFVGANSTANLYLGQKTYKITATNTKGISFSVPQASDALFINNGGNVSIGGHSSLVQPYQRLTFNSFFQPDSILESDGDTAIFTYGNRQNRITSARWNNEVFKKKTYLPNYEIEQYAVAPKRELHYINTPDGNTIIIARSQGIDSVFYVFTDHLGSWCTVGNSKGNLIQQLHYDSWGLPVNNENVTDTTFQLFCDRGYTGHEHMSDFALINMNGRLYDPVIGKMLRDCLKIYLQHKPLTISSLC